MEEKVKQKQQKPTGLVQWVFAVKLAIKISFFAPIMSSFVC